MPSTIGPQNSRRLTDSARHYSDMARLLGHPHAGVMLADNTLCARVVEWRKSGVCASVGSIRPRKAGDMPIATSRSQAGRVGARLWPQTVAKCTSRTFGAKLRASLDGQKDPLIGIAQSDQSPNPPGRPYRRSMPNAWTRRLKTMCKVRPAEARAFIQA